MGWGGEKREIERKSKRKKIDIILICDVIKKIEKERKKTKMEMSYKRVRYLNITTG